MFWFDVPPFGTDIHFSYVLSSVCYFILFLDSLLSNISLSESLVTVCTEPPFAPGFVFLACLHCLYLSLFNHKCLSVYYHLLRNCEISWLWYTYNLSLSFTSPYFLLVFLVILLCKSTNTHLLEVSVKCVTQPLSPLPLFNCCCFSLWLWSQSRPSCWVSKLSLTIDRGFFFISSYSRNSPISHVNMKWQQCQKASHAERSHLLSLQHISVASFESDWTQASLQIPTEAAVPLFLWHCLTELHGNTGLVE